MMMMIMRSVISMHVRQFSSPESGSCGTACTDHTGIHACPLVTTATILIGKHMEYIL